MFVGLCFLLGIELVLGTRVISADMRRKTLLTATGETISFKILIIATGARVLKLISTGLKLTDRSKLTFIHIGGWVKDQSARNSTSQDIFISMNETLVNNMVG